MIVREIAGDATLPMVYVCNFEICERRGNVAPISFARTFHFTRIYPPRDKRLILNRDSRNLASTHFVVDSALPDREKSIKDADRHCLAFSAGPTFATCIGGPPRYPDESLGFLNLASGAFTTQM